MCSNGYPDKYKKNIKINQIKNIKLDNDEYIFHAGTKIKDEEIFSNWWESIKYCCTTENFKNSKDKTIKILNDLDWKEGFFRKDIAYKVIKYENNWW